MGLHVAAGVKGALGDGVVGLGNDDDVMRHDSCGPQFALMNDALSFLSSSPYFSFFFFIPCLVFSLL